MPSLRSLWFAVGMVGIFVAVAVLLGAVYGDAGLSVRAVEATGETPTNATANCDDVVVRTVTASVTVAREDLSFQNPQVWDVGLSVRASAFDQAETRHLSLSPGESRSVSLAFTHVRPKSWAPQQHVDMLVQVTHGNTNVAERSVTTTLQPVKAGESC